MRAPGVAAAGLAHTQGLGAHNFHFHFGRLRRVLLKKKMHSEAKELEESLPFGASSVARSKATVDETFQRRRRSHVMHDRMACARIEALLLHSGAATRHPSQPMQRTERRHASHEQFVSRRHLAFAQRTHDQLRSAKLFDYRRLCLQLLLYLKFLHEVYTAHAALHPTSPFVQWAAVTGKSIAELSSHTFYWLSIRFFVCESSSSIHALCPRTRRPLPRA